LLLHRSIILLHRTNNPAPRTRHHHRRLHPPRLARPHHRHLALITPEHPPHAGQRAHPVGVHHDPRPHPLHPEPRRVAPEPPRPPPPPQPPPTDARGKCAATPRPPLAAPPLLPPGCAIRAPAPASRASAPAARAPAPPAPTARARRGRPGSATGAAPGGVAPL